MFRSFRQQLLVLFFSGLSITNSFGQSHPLLELEYRFGLLKAATHSPNVVNQKYSTTGDGLSRESTIGLGYKQPITSFLHNSLSLDGSAGIQQSFGTFAASDGTFSLAHTATFLQVGTNLSHSFSTANISLGAWLDIPIAQSLTETIPSQGVTISNNSLLYSSSPYGLRLEIGLVKPLLSSLAIYPDLFSEFDLGAYRQSNINIAQASSVGVGLRWNFSSTTEDTLPSEAPPKPVVSALQAHIDFTYHGRKVRSNDIVPIEPTDTIFRQYTMLPSLIPSSFHKLSNAEAIHFSNDSLERLSIEQFSAELLNIVALRLRTSENQSIELRSRDTFSVRDASNYLGTIFGIKKNQIRQTFDNSQQRDIRIIPSSNSLWAPVVTQWIERNYILDEIGLNHSIHATADPHWHITVEQRGGPITTISDSRFNGTTMSLDGIRASNNSPIIATLYVSDSTGNQIAASDTLHLGLVNTDPTIAPTVTRFILLADSSQTAAIDILFQKIHSLLPAKNVAVDYYFDRSGFPSWLHTQISQSGIVGRESSHILDTNDVVGPRAVITIQK